MSHSALQGTAELAQQFVTGNMSTGVVDHFKLVEVHKAQGVLALIGEQGGEQTFSASLKFGAINQPGQGVVAGLIIKLFTELIFVGDIFLYRDIVRYFIKVVFYRRDGIATPVIIIVFCFIV